MDILEAKDSNYAFSKVRFLCKFCGHNFVEEIEKCELTSHSEQENQHAALKHKCPSCGKMVYW